MKRDWIRVVAVLIVLLSITQRAWAPPVRPAPRTRPHPIEVRPESRSGRIEPGRGYDPAYQPDKPFEGLLRRDGDPVKMERGIPGKEPAKEAEAIRRLLYDKKKLTIEDLVLLEGMRWDYHLTFEERRILERELDALKPRETEPERFAREFHESYLPGQEILLPAFTLAKPTPALRTLLATDVARLRKTRMEMQAFHRGIERLRRSGWDAQRALKAASEAEEAKRAAAATLRPRLVPRPQYWSRREQPRPLPPEVKKLLPQDAGSDWERYAFRALTGQDSAASLAYVDFLYATALSGAGEFRTLAKLDVGREPASSVAETATLRTLTRTLVADARVRTAKSVLQQLPELARDAAAPPPAHRFAAVLPTDTMQVALAKAGKEVRALHKMPEWERPAKLGKRIEGFTSTAKTIDAYVRNGNSLELVRVDRKSGRTSYLPGAEARAALRNHSLGQIRKYSRPGFRLADVMRDKDGYRIVMADRKVRLMKAEVAQLERGERLPPEHPLSQAIASDPSFVVYSNPLMAREGVPRSDAEHLAFAVQRTYREARVFKDDLSEHTESRARAVNEFVIRDASDVLILKDRAVDDANIVNDIADDLTKSGMRVEELKEGVVLPPAERTRLVIVISGHIDEKMADFVRRAGEAGYFKNNIIAFNSCASELTSQLVHEMNTRYGAVATFRYEGKIPAVKVQEILMKLHDDISHQPKLDDLKHYVHDEGLAGVWNICRLLRQEVWLG